MGHLKSLFTLLFFFIITTSLAVTFAGKIPAVIVFGDSTVDAGNNNYIPTVARSNFEPYGRDFDGGKPTGRFCNGKIATDFMSEAIGLKPTIPAYLDPSYNISDFATGVTFASAATGYDNATSDVLSVLPLWKQLEYYKEYQTKLEAYQGKDRATDTITNSLYLISIGTNDFLENYFAFPGRSSQYSVDLYQDFLAGIAKDFVTKLHGLGARKISLGGLPPMGCMPLERATNIGTGGECVGRFNDIAVQFNGKLERLVEKLSKELSGSVLVFSNPYEPFMRIIKNPSSFGFEVAAAACCATGMFEMGYSCQRNNPFTCSNADKYVFWDSFHPTQKTHRIMANFLMNDTFSHFL
ncbi:hypothetical protein IGI04_012664 [Brassica rapa subsp. trilocularis]|uniref:GDSL esterase/lipase n=1 Tax=Brassica rapa subsp. trilocularis TaxID=1813537 RepID=A0ABQ7N6K7_BRACM|nr:hypothetical protein IGI04_012664 [Brassica rapa subsp. trilocularis]